MHALGRYAVINMMNWSRLESDVVTNESLQRLQESKILVLQEVLYECAC